MIAIIDYKAGNLTSVARAVQYLGFACKITSDPREIQAAERVIFPGVGAAGSAMADLKAMGLDEAIRKFYTSGKPLLGICLGTQIILNFSEENGTTCMGLIPGKVKRFPQPLMNSSGESLKVPHMGWNSVQFKRDHPVLEGVPKDSQFYFVHTYFPEPTAMENILGLTEYGIFFPSAIARKNLAAFQFHPEKSGPPGLKILDNFCRWEGTHAD